MTGAFAVAQVVGAATYSATWPPGWRQLARLPRVTVAVVEVRAISSHILFPAFMIGLAAWAPAALFARSDRLI